MLRMWPWLSSSICLIEDLFSNIRLVWLILLPIMQMKLAIFSLDVLECLADLFLSTWQLSTK